MKTYSSNIGRLSERNGPSLSTSGSSPLSKGEMGPTLISADNAELLETGLVG
jgi:hypothetical protein